MHIDQSCTNNRPAFRQPCGSETYGPVHYISGSNSAGRVTAFQAVGREFEPRLPLFLCALHALSCITEIYISHRFSFIRSPHTYYVFLFASLTHVVCFIRSAQCRPGVPVLRRSKPLWFRQLSLLQTMSPRRPSRGPVSYIFTTTSPSDFAVFAPKSRCTMICACGLQSIGFVF